MKIIEAERSPVYGTIASTPEEQFVFVGDGPYYVFEHHDWYQFGLDEAFNWCERLCEENGATFKHRQRSYIFPENGERCFYDEFIVKLPGKKSAPPSPERK